MIAKPYDGSWPNLVYRFVEHYKWERQHLEGTVEEFSSRIRRQEVPLNFLLNFLLRCSSTDTIASILEEFSSARFDDDELLLCFPYETKLVQPDVQIESARARVFIEVKVDASIKLEQIQKYLLLHAVADVDCGEKDPYLFFLTAKPFQDCWRPFSTDLTEALNLDEFFSQKTAVDQLPVRLQTFLGKRNAIARYNAVRQRAKFGACTWSSLGRRMETICDGYVSSHGRHLEGRMIGDFLDDLKQRDLLLPFLPRKPLSAGHTS